MQLFWSIFAVIAVFGLVVCFHEFGHYIVAKLCGIGVEIFSFGMGPRAFGWKRGETDYRVSWLPIGGYVKLQGDEEPASDAINSSAAPVAVALDPARNFALHPKWQRLAVMAAGAVFNLILAFFLFCGLKYGKQPAALGDQAPPLIVSVAPDSPAAKAELLPLDLITAVGDNQVATAFDARFQISTNTKGNYSLTVMRAGQSQTVTITPQIMVEKGEPRGVLGVNLPLAFAAPPAGSPAQKAGVQRMDMLLAAGGIPVDKLAGEKASPLDQAELLTLPLQIYRSGATQELTLTRVAGEDWGLEVVEYHYNGVTAALREGLSEMGRLSTLLYHSIAKMFRGQSSMKGLSGPVGIIKMIGGSSSGNFRQLFFIAAFISLQLAVVNLLPIPALDGGHILILLLEGLMRRDFAVRTKERIIEFGFYGLLALLALLIIMDVTKLFQ